MEKKYLYLGEDWVFTLRGDSVLDLSDPGCDFVFMVYPNGKPSEAVSVDKNACTQIQKNVFKCVIEYTRTKSLQPGIYAVEVLIKSGPSMRSVFADSMAFCAQDSASKNIK